MTIAQQLLQINANLDRWAKTRHGRSHIAADPFDLFEIIRQVPAGFRCAVMFHSELKRGDYEESGVVDRLFWVGLSRGRGMKLERGADLVKQSAAGGPLFDLVEQGRQILRQLQFDSVDPLDPSAGLVFPLTTEVHIDYRATRPLSVEGYLLDAYNLEFSIGCQLDAPDVLATSDNALP